jgi:hypothetical protein
MQQFSEKQIFYEKQTSGIAEMWRAGATLGFYLFRKWWLIALMGFFGGVLGFLIAYLEKPKYQSHLTFALEDGEGGLGGALSLAAEFGFNLGSSKNLFEGDNILSLLVSRRIIERVLLSVDTLNGKPITMANYFNRISSDTTKKKVAKKLSAMELRLRNVSFPAGQTRETFSYLQDSVLLNLYKVFAIDGALKVGKPDKKLNLFEIAVTSPDERFSKVFTDKLVKEATEFYIELKTRKSKETLDVLELRVSQTKGALNNAINSRANLQDANVNPVFQQAEAGLQKKQVDISAYGGAYAELYKNLEMARFQYLQEKPLLQVIDPADYPMKRIKKGKISTAIIFAVIISFLMVLILIVQYVISTELKKEKLLLLSK